MGELNNIEELKRENSRLREINDGIMGDHYCDTLNWYFEECDRLRGRLDDYENAIPYERLEEAAELLKEHDEQVILIDNIFTNNLHAFDRVNIMNSDEIRMLKQKMRGLVNE